MDHRPLGPRPDNRRHAAYQDIFGCANPPPSQPAPLPRNYPPQAAYAPYPPGPSQQQYAYQHQMYAERRQSYDSAYPQSVYGQQQQQQPQQQHQHQAYPLAHPVASSNPAMHPQYYASPAPSQVPLPYYPNYAPGVYNAPASAGYAPQPGSQQPLQPHLGPPSNVHNRARSMASAHHTPGTIAPRPEEPPDPQLEALMRTGLTPAQAYQHQVYQQHGTPGSGVPQPYQNNNHHALPSPPPSSTYSHTTTAYTLGNGSGVVPPHIGISFEGDDGRLGIDFESDSGSSPSGTDESNGPQQRNHHRTPSAQLNDQGRRPHSLQVDTSLPTTPGSDASAVSTDALARRSTESSRTMAGASRRSHSHADRSRSLSAVTGMSSIRTVMDSPASRAKSVAASVLSGVGAHPHSAMSSPASMKPRTNAPRRAPLVYPALLSRVAQAFRERITLSDRVKDGLTYTDTFDGREAVDKIAYIIKTTDRNLALLLGRALDAQKFFHDVTYDHRLRDSLNELYQFRTTVPSPFVSAETVTNSDALARAFDRQSVITDTTVSPQSTPSMEQSVDGHDDAISPVTPKQARKRTASDASLDDVLPSGVFTLLTDCYSPTCSRDQLCYSIACPRRLEQQARLNMKPQPGLKREISKESLGDAKKEPGTLWIHSVSKEIADSVSDTEKKRQEAINEVMYTERDFVRDMEYLRDVWINPLKVADVIPEGRRTDFLEQVFWNIHDIIAVNTRLRDALSKRQKHYAVVERIGDILLDAVPHFGPFVSYGAHQLYGKYEFEKEKSSNPAFAAFVEATERLPESRKLELNGYLTKPTTRLARYPLLLEAVLKHTPEDNPDKQALPQVVAMIREFLAKVNAESGKTENRFNLLQLDQQLVFRQGEQVDLRLREEGRELVYKGALNKRGGAQGENGELQVFLFDHALLMAKQKSKHDQYKVYRRPIPLELLVVSIIDESASSRKGAHQKHVVLSKNAFGRNGPHPPSIPVKIEGGKGGFSITFVHLGRKFYQMTLWASTQASHKKWIEHILEQQDLMRQRSMIFDTEILSEGFFLGQNKVNCAAPYNGGKRMVYGTDDGVYLSDARSRDPVKVLALLDVTQVDVLEEYQLLVVLSERQVITFPMDSLDPHDPTAGLKRAKRISSHINFFKAGYCLGRALVCVVKSSALSSTIKTFEPIDQVARGRSKPTFKKLLQGGNDTLRVFREFYIPFESTSIHFLKTRLCIGCNKGFQIVDLKTLDTQGLLDPADESVEFAQKREAVLKAMAIYRIDSEFLLCYDEFAFYVNRNGWRSRKDFIVHWEGSPTGFALHYPYVLAFEPSFVEIRHVETGAMAQIIQGNNIRLLFADMPPSTLHSSGYAYEQQQQGYNPYGYAGSAVTSYSSRSFDPYSGQPTMAFPTPNTYQASGSQSPGVGRNEIIMVSDDRIMILRVVGGELSLQNMPYTSDGASVASMPR